MKFLSAQFTREEGTRFSDFFIARLIWRCAEDRSEVSGRRPLHRKDRRATDNLRLELVARRTALMGDRVPDQDDLFEKLSFADLV